jgi:BirA family biotin operon repressor/biotin-[acetyl-CoA-carboxylase] ligase
VGLNVSTRRDELPRDDATSLELERGQPVDRAPLLLAVLRSVESAYRWWLAVEGDPETALRPYRALSATLGRTVRAELPGGATLVGDAVDVGPYGQLVLDVSGARQVLSAADVVHLRPG